MRLLFIGGTGLISSACSELAVADGHELFMLNRGVSVKNPAPQGATILKADARSDPDVISKQLGGLRFDAVVDFIAFTPEDVEGHLGFLAQRTSQYVFISSASAYQKPPSYYLVNENTPLANPYWKYSQDKIACEELLRSVHGKRSLQVTVVRPSLTYGVSQMPLCVGSWEHPWTVIDRIRRKLPVVVPGDGTSLWVLTWNGDFARGLMGLLSNPGAFGEAFNIMSHEVLTWNQIYEEVFVALGVPVNLVHIPTELIAAYWPHAWGSLMGDKIHSTVFDTSKVKSLVPSFDCKVKWSDGLRRAISWHESNPQFQTIDGEFNGCMDRLIHAYREAFPED